MPRRSTNK